MPPLFRPSARSRPSPNLSEKFVSARKLRTRAVIRSISARSKKPSPTDRAACGAQKSVRSVQCGSQATALTHQGPQEEWDAASPGTTTARGRSLGSSIWREQNASIIAPRREGSQLGGADTPRPVGIRKISRALALLPHEGISRRQYLWSPMEVLRLSHPVVKGVNYRRRYTKARRSSGERGPWHYHRTRVGRAAVSSGNDGSAPIIAPAREGSQSPAPPPKLVSTQTANDGREGQPLAA